MGWQLDIVVTLIISRRPLKTMQIRNSHNKFALGQIMGIDACSLWVKSRSVESKWRPDVPWSWRCFSAHEKGAISACLSLFRSFRSRLLSTHMVPLFESVYCFAVCLVKALDESTADSVRSAVPRKHWAAEEIPAVYDRRQGRLRFLEKTPLWGAAYCKGFLNQIDEYLAVSYSA